MTPDLLASVDAARDEIVVRVVRAVQGGERFKLTAHIFDAFKTAQRVDLDGWAERRACTTGALWIFVLAPKTSKVREQLDTLAASARC